MIARFVRRRRRAGESQPTLHARRALIALNGSRKNSARPARRGRIVIASGEIKMLPRKSATPGAFFRLVARSLLDYVAATRRGALRCASRLTGVRTRHRQEIRSNSLQPGRSPRAGSARTSPGTYPGPFRRTSDCSRRSGPASGRCARQFRPCCPGACAPWRCGHGCR